MFIIFPSITFKNEHQIYKQQEVKLYHSQSLISMSQALENKENNQQDQEDSCQQCKAGAENHKYDNLCENDLNQPKEEVSQLNQKFEEKSQQQIGFSKFTQVFSKDQTIFNQNEAIEASEKLRLEELKKEIQNAQKQAALQSDLKFQKLDDSQNGQMEEKGLQCQKDNKKASQFHLKESKPPDDAELGSNNPDITRRKKTFAVKRKICQREVQFINEQELIPKKRDYAQFIEKSPPIKGRCILCNKRTGLLGTYCSHCDQEYCNTHRLPEDHKCSTNFAEEARRYKLELLGSLLPKHKGKIAEI